MATTGNGKADYIAVLRALDSSSGKTIDVYTKQSLLRTPVTVFYKTRILTAGSDAAAQRQDSMTEDYATGKQNFYLQYFFPPSSVGETGRTGGMPGRREVGHGMLAQRALAPIVPDEVYIYALTASLQNMLGKWKPPPHMLLN